MSLLKYGSTNYYKLLFFTKLGRIGYVLIAASHIEYFTFLRESNLFYSMNGPAGHTLLGDNVRCPPTSLKVWGQLTRLQAAHNTATGSASKAPMGRTAVL